MTDLETPACPLTEWEAEAGGSEVQGQPGKFSDTLSLKEKKRELRCGSVE